MNEQFQLPFSLKGRFPFRLGTTSFILPADIVPNVEALAPFVDDVELLLFESPPHAPLPTPDMRKRLASLARKHDLSYTVHLPLDIAPGSTDAGERLHAIDTLKKCIDRMLPLEPAAFVLHLPDKRSAERASPPDPLWMEAVDDTLAELLGTSL